MGRKHYREYTSYQYLEAGRDYRQFELVDELARVPSTRVPTTDEQEQRVQRLLTESVVVSAHDHPSVRPIDPHEGLAYRRQGREFTGFRGLAASGIDVVFDGLMNGTNIIGGHAPWKWEDTLYDIGMRLSDWAHQQLTVPILRFEDVERVHTNGQIGVVLALESASPVENEIDRVDVLYGFGVRSMGLVYSDSNLLGGGLADAGDGGLTRFGKQVVRRMNQLGMIVDVAHTGDQTALQAVAASGHPVIISHAGARGLWATRRMKPDDVIRACADSGGLIGIEAAPHTTLTERHSRHSLESVMEHFEYCANLVGIDHVAFGPDTHFGDHVGWHHAFASQLSISEAHGAGAGPQFEEVPFVDGIENPAEEFHNITRWLVVHGYSDADIQKAIGGNMLRVMRAVWR
ncbi:MAG: membrane dipeptidase [Chloroflexi bacterium]|nr:membrane dipeptidase [Chloroflexota bacterium]